MDVIFSELNRTELICSWNSLWGLKLEHRNKAIISREKGHPRNEMSSVRRLFSVSLVPLASFGSKISSTAGSGAGECASKDASYFHTIMMQRWRFCGEGWNMDETQIVQLKMEVGSIRFIDVSLGSRGG